MMLANIYRYGGGGTVPECVGEEVHPRALVPQLVPVTDSEGDQVLLE